MASVGNGVSGRTLIGTGVTSSPTFASIGTSSGLTSRGVVVAQGLGAFQATNPGSAGQVLQSGGALANPSYSVPTYPSISGTARQIIVSDGINNVYSTETWAVPGNSGNVLTSDGVNWTSASPGGGFSPNTIINLYDDYVSCPTYTAGGSTPNALGSNIQWLVSSTNSWSSVAGDSGHFGVVGSSSMTANSCFLQFLTSAKGQNTPLVLGGGAITINWVIKVATLSTGTNTYTLRFGLGNSVAGDQTDGVYFEYTNAVNSGNYQYKTASASVRTTSNSSIAPNTSAYVNCQITINAAATSCSFAINGVSLGTAITNNIPTAGISPFISIVWSAGTVAASSLLVDLFYMTQTLTTPR